MRCAGSSTGQAGRGADGAAVRSLAALAVYGAAFSALLLPKLLSGGPGRILSNSPADGALLLWALGWWPHAIAHGHLLPYTHALFAPEGTNLTWTTSIPTAGVLLAPLTAASSVFTSFNVLSVLAPVTAGWTTYLLVHHVTKRWWASTAAGMVFALSPLETTQVAAGHLNLSLTALVPLGTYLVVRLLDGSLAARAFVPSMALVLAAELGISTEVFATASLFGGLALVLLFAWDRPRRERLRRCAGPLALAYAGAGAVAAPFLYAAFALPRPPGLVSANGPATPFSGVETHVHANATLALVIAVGVPLFVLLVSLAWSRRRPPVVRALAATAAVALLCTPGILVVGNVTVPTVWTLARHLPLVRLVRPQRLSMFVWLIGAAGAGAWIAERQRSWRRWAVVTMAVGALLPPVWLGSWTSAVPASPFPSGGLDPAHGENVAVVAGSPSRSMQYADLAFPSVWQVESGFSFRLANGYVGSFPPSLPSAVRRFMFGGSWTDRDRAPVRAWLRRNRVGMVMVARPGSPSIGRVRRLLGTQPFLLRGAALFRVPR